MVAPWLGTALAQVRRGQGWRQPVSLGQIPDQVSDLVRMLMFGVYRVPSLRSWSCLVVLTVLASGLLCVLVRAVTTRDGERHAFLALLAFVPFVIGLAVLPITGHLDLSRYLLYTTPLIILSAACGLSSLPAPTAAVICVLFIGGVTPLASLASYYESRVKDYDARPIVTYLGDAARHGPGAVQDTIVVAPGYLIDVLRYLSRGDLTYHRADSDADIVGAAAIASRRNRPIWLIVDYRWAGFNAVAHDPRFVAREIPLGASDKIRLFCLQARDKLSP
jgi:hypothetical protein